MNTAITASEGRQLAACEAVIESGLRTFADVGSALLAIRDGRLYRATHGTFEDYCKERWGFSKSRANQLVSAAVVVCNLATNVAKPTSEAQARPLLPIGNKPSSRQQLLTEGPG